MSWESALQIDRIKPSSLVQSPFLPNIVLGLIRLALLLTDIWVMTLAGIMNAPATFFIYATNWGGVLNLWYLFVVNIVTWRSVVEDDSEQNNKFIKLAYISQEIALPISLMIVVMYWTVVNPSATFSSPIGEVNAVQNHAGSCAMVLLDFTFSEMQFIPRHIVGSILIFVLYLPVNAAYTLSVEPVYAVMTWRSWSTAVLIVMVFLAIVLFYFILVGFSKLKDRKSADNRSNDPNMIVYGNERHVVNPVEK